MVKHVISAKPEGVCKTERALTPRFVDECCRRHHSFLGGVAGRTVELHHGNNQLYPGSGMHGEPGKRTSSMPWSRAMTSAPLLGEVMA